MSRIIRYLKCAVFFLIILTVTGITIAKRNETVSCNENKVLASFPTLSFNSWKSEKFMDGVGDWFSDHIAFREPLIRIKNRVDILCGKEEINGVYNCDGNLILLFKGTDMTQTGINLETVNSLGGRCGGRLVFALVPTAQQKYSALLPSWLDLDDEISYISYCKEKLSAAEFISFEDEIADEGYAFYRTDHHWTTMSACRAYIRLGSLLGYTPEENELSCVAEDFRGTLFSKTLDSSVKPDDIQVCADLPADITFRYKDRGTDYVAHKLIFEEKLEEKDKYLCFLGGNYGVAEIENPHAPEGSLLIIKDSYANCLVPMLSRHFSRITLVDPRYVSQSELSGISLSSYDKVLVLFNVSGFSEEKNLVLTEFINQEEKS